MLKVLNLVADLRASILHADDVIAVAAADLPSSRGGLRKHLDL